MPKKILSYLVSPGHSERRPSRRGVGGLFIILTLLLGLLIPVTAASADTIPETVNLDTALYGVGTPNTFVSSSNTLESGASYQLSIVGNWSAWPPSDVLTKAGHDATIYESPSVPGPTQSALDASYRYDSGTPVAFDGVFYSVDGGTTFNPLPRPQTDVYNSAHSYTYIITGTGNTVAFRTGDTYGDDHGVMQITISAAVTSLGRTPWQMLRPAFIVTNVSPYPGYHGDPILYNFAPPIPASDDPNWGPVPDPDTINFHSYSRLGVCLGNQADFSFFQTFVSIPSDTQLTTATITFSDTDDGAQVTIFNSSYPNGHVEPGVTLGQTSTSDLAQYLVAGEINRVVVTQVDDCPVGNNLGYAAVVLNGTTIHTNQPPVVAADSSSITVDEGQTAINTGTFSDPDGDTVSLSASVGTVTETGTGTWGWSFSTTDGPSQSQTVTIFADDGNEHTATTTFPLTVNNVAPGLAVNVGSTNTVYYVDWTSANPGAGTASGVINLPGGSAVNVTFEALNLDESPSFFYGAQTSGGTNFWIPSAPYVSAEVPNAPPDSDILQLSGGTSTIYKVTLSQPIVDPIMAIVSLGSGGNTITYNFDSPFTIVSQGTGYWGGGPASLVQLPNNVLQGTEGHGTIKFLGTYSTFSWTVPNPETWHGFTFAIRTTESLGNTNVNEGEIATNTGTWNDPGIDDDVQLTASVGTVVKSADGTWNWSFATTDGPSQTQTVTITATDKDGAMSSVPFPLVVNNVAPTVNAGADQEAECHLDTTFGGAFTDPAGSQDEPYDIQWDFGDGDIAAGTLTPTHQYQDTGTYTVTLTVTDTDGDTESDMLTVTVVDTTPPTASITVDRDTYYTTESALVGVTVGDACDDVPSYEVTLTNNSAAPVVINEGPLNLADLAGHNVVTVTATDVSGNVSTASASFDVILQLPDGSVIIKPESLKVNPGEFTAQVILPAPYDALNITSAVADGAPDQKINYDALDHKAIIKFDRVDVDPALLDTNFEVTGTFVYNGGICQFVGSDSIMKVDTEAVPDSNGKNKNK